MAQRGLSLSAVSLSFLVFPIDFHERPIATASPPRAHPNLLRVARWDGAFKSVDVAVVYQLEAQSIALYNHAHEYASSRGILLADTKLEFGTVDGSLIVIDEMLTPDSSRFWEAVGYQPGRAQPNFDKQFVRDWLMAEGWDREPPAPDLPDDVVEKTSERYVEVYRRLTGRDLT